MPIILLYLQAESFCPAGSSLPLNEVVVDLIKTHKLEGIVDWSKKIFNPTGKQKLIIWVKDLDSEKNGRPSINLGEDGRYEEATNPDNLHYTLCQFNP